MTSASGGALSNLTITRVDRSAVPPVPAGATYSFTGIAYDIEPSGATFDPYVTLIITLPESDWNALANQDLSIKWYNTATSQWEDLQTTVNPSFRMVSAKITHTTVFGLFTLNPSTPVPTTIVPADANRDTDQGCRSRSVPAIRHDDTPDNCRCSNHHRFGNHSVPDAPQERKNIR